MAKTNPKKTDTIKMGYLLNYEEKKTRVAQFNLTSDIFFSKVIENKAACQEIIKIFTGRDLKIREIKSQYSIRHLESHSVVLDVLAESRSGKLINIEMQTGENEDHLKRSRYHQACIDVSMLEKGRPFEHLPELYSIFITTKDFFKCGSGIYHIDRVLREGNLTIDNGIREICVNLQGKVNNPVLRALLSYIKNTDADYENEHFPHLIKRVRYYKQEKEGLDSMCDIIDAFIKGGREAGIAMGVELGKAEGIELGKAEGIELGKAEGIELGKAEGIEFGKAEGIELGKAQGLELGSKNGQSRVNHLNQLLASQNRISDIIKSASEPAYQQKLFQEFHL